MPKEILVATKNKYKVIEITKLLNSLGITLKSLSDYPEVPEVIEDKESFIENAAKKAIEYSKFSGIPALADDSGLEVDVLDGRPGVHSARYAGEEQDDKKNIRKLLDVLDGVTPDKRTANFKCLVVLAQNDNILATAEGKCEGTITFEPTGKYGFGYDPIFIPKGYDKTFSELGAEVKDKISHRAIAFNKMAEIIKKRNIF
jgi:XTP/dITP diphosphohydrolase